MRGFLILMLYSLVGNHAAMALSGRFTAELSPSCSMNRIYCQTKPIISQKGAAIRMHFGTAYHIRLEEYASLSIGISYAFGHIGLVRISDPPIPSIDETHLLQAIWLPLLCRFYTSEVMIDMSIYVKIGIVPAVYLPTRPSAPLAPKTLPFITIRRFGCFILLGSGVKYDFSIAGSLACGLSYYWDPSGVLHKKDEYSGEVYCHNHFLCLDICCFF